MKERINWIDWAKALAVTTVVFCHLPQSQEWFYYRYLQACIITIFFFLSGYLKKNRGSEKENWRKYWHGLILPYLLWNAIVYPYWLTRYYMLNGGMPDFFHAMKPILGALLFQHENSFCEPLNGPLWYLPAILFMHVLVDLCRKTKHQHGILITLCFISFFLYAANKQWGILPNLTPIGIVRRLPYYYIGYVMGQNQLFRNKQKWLNLIGCVICFAASLLLFEWHLHEENLFIHVALFYPINIGFLFGVMCGCKLLDQYKSKIIINLSVGTLVIIGFHAVVIGIVNFVLSHFSLFSFHFSPQYGYHWYEALPVSLMIVALLYPILLWGKKQTPILLGR